MQHNPEGVMTTSKETAPAATNRRAVWSWAFFDFANSVYPAVITTAVFPIFYKNVVVGEGGGVGDLWWTRAVSLSALIIAVTAPVLGSIADRTGARKRFMFFYTIVCVVGVASMTTLGPGMLVAGFLIFVLANVGFEGAVVFYNAYLPDIAPRERQGRVSGLGFGLGYFGSAIGLGLALVFVMQERMDAVWLLTAAFFLVFSVPAFVALPSDRRGTGVLSAAGQGIRDIKEIVAELRHMKDLRNFLIAFFFFIDGVLTIIVVAALVAEETFGFTQTGVIVLFFIVQFSAAAGAFLLAKPTDLFGPKKVLTGVLALWTAAGIAAYFIQGQQAFYVLAVFAGFGLGAVQSASRALMSSLIPKGQEAKMFGFYALCGKSSSVLGPLLFGQVTYWAGGNQRPGFLVLTALFIVGGLLLQRVRDPKAPATSSGR